MSPNSKKPKKPAKKAASKPKLIEGKYSHKFLTRLEPAEGEALEKLLQLIQHKTYNGAVRHVITDYQRIVKELKETYEKLGVAMANAAQYKRHIEVFLSSIEAMRTIKPVTKIQTSIFDHART